MRIIFAILIATGFATMFTACNSGSGPATFCDTACLKDSIKFTGEHPLKPYLYISAKNCLADTITWSYEGAESNRKLGFADLLKDGIRINKDFTRCYIADTAQAWLMFNNCETGRGYQIRLPFNKAGKMIVKVTAINNIDKKFAIADNLAAYSDRGNLFVEDMVTGKKAMMTFGQALEIDYDNIHATIDSVNITATKIWAKVMIDGNWKTFEKTITLQ